MVIFETIILTLTGNKQIRHVPPPRRLSHALYGGATSTFRWLGLRCMCMCHSLAIKAEIK